jgi:hypothetical protein
MALEEEAVAVSPAGAEAAVLHVVDKSLTSMPLTTGWFAAPSLKAITILPLLLAVAVKVFSRAALAPTVA